MANQTRFLSLSSSYDFARRYRRELFACLLVAAAVSHMAVAEAARTPRMTLAEEKVVALQVAAMQNELLPPGHLPQASRRWTIRVPITAYSSEPGQTDDTPFITASGTHVRDGIVAANFLPMGTRVRIPEIYGNKEFVVEDRMNARYSYHMDVWMEETPQARQFGRKFAEVEVFQN